MAGPTSNEAMKQEIPQGLLQRAKAGLRYTLGGAGQSPSTFFGPLDPLPPMAQETAAGRRFDYRSGYNLNITPRSGEAVSFSMLRNLADGYDLLRLVIETRKDQMAKFKFKFAPLDDDAKPDDRCDTLAHFFRYPDQENSWETWMRAVIEEVLVTDAVAIYPHRNIGGGVYGLELMDGGTIRRIIDVTGRTPLPPNPAYQQVIKGLPAADYSRDDLVYRIRNMRVNRVYGYSPVEQVIATVNIALRRQLSQMQYYTEGSAPDLLMQTPETWQPNQIQEFQDHWDARLRGDTAERRGGTFIPHGVTPFNLKDMILKDEYDEWLARIVCFAFSIAPTPFIKQMNRATAQTVTQQALNEGILPLQVWFKNLIDYCVYKYWGYTDLQFLWEEEESVDPLVQAQINQIYLSEGVLTDDEVRKDLGLDPLTDEQRDKLAPPPAVPGVIPATGQETGGVAPPSNSPDGSAAQKSLKAQKKSLSTANGERSRPGLSASHRY